MATEMKLPELGENIEEGDVVRVLVNTGDSITQEQPVIEIETDKAAIEVPSTVSGKITEIKIKEGEKARVGQTLIVVDANGAGTSAKAETTVKTAAKATPEKKAPSASTPSKEKATAAAPQSTTSTPGKPPVAAAPSVRRLARELGVQLSAVQGSGPRGMIVTNDVKRAAGGSSPAGTSASAGTTLPTTPLPDFSTWGTVRREAMASVRRATATHLSRAWVSIPHVTQHDKADITAIEEFRKNYGKVVQEAGGKLTVTSIAVKIVAAALRKFPKFNCSIDMNSKEIIYKDYVHVGIAVDTKRGLLVPVIRDADKKTLIELSVEIGTLAGRARDRKTTLEEMSGGTFTITNLGGIGGTNFTPIINSPEVAILGMSRASIEPRYINGQFVPRTIAPLSLSYDHRIIDGADAARFLRWIAQALEQPLLLTLDDA